MCSLVSSIEKLNIDELISKEYINKSGKNIGRNDLDIIKSRLSQNFVSNKSMIISPFPRPYPYPYPNPFPDDRYPFPNPYPRPITNQDPLTILLKKIRDLIDAYLKNQENKQKESLDDLKRNLGFFEKYPCLINNDLPGFLRENCNHKDCLKTYLEKRDNKNINLKN